MIEKIVRITSMSCFLLFSLILGVHANDNGFVIQLKNGNTFETRTYHEYGNMVYFDRYETRIGIDKGTVETIQPKQVVSAVAVDNSVEYMGHLRMPGYYRVSGLADRGRHTYNGLYEERGKHNDRPRYKQINGSNDLFYRCLDYKHRPDYETGTQGRQCPTAAIGI